MSSPQLENGYTKISNEIMEALARIRIPGEARQMLDVIIRKTYGFNKTIDQIATSQFTQATGLKKFIIHRARKRLLLAKLITVCKNANSQILSYSFQKDCDKWITVCKNAQCAKKVTNSMQKCSPTVTIIDGHKRKKETITKERWTSPTLEDVKTYCLERKNKVDPDKWHSWYTANGWKVGKNPMKDWRAAVRTWESKDNMIINKPKPIKPDDPPFKISPIERARVSALIHQTALKMR